MRDLTLGSTGITVPQNGFGALPVQRRNVEDAVEILRICRVGAQRTLGRLLPRLRILHAYLPCRDHHQPVRTHVAYAEARAVRGMAVRALAE